THEFRDTLQGFLDRFGWRGPNEWELASDTWATNPAIALAAVDRLRRTEREDPVAVGARLAEERRTAIDTVARAVPAPARGMFRRATSTMAEGAGGREFAKGTIVLALFAARLAL